MGKLVFRAFAAVLFFGGLGIFAAENFAPEMLSYLGSYQAVLTDYAIAAFFVGGLLFLISQLTFGPSAESVFEEEMKKMPLSPGETPANSPLFSTQSEPRSEDDLLKLNKSWARSPLVSDQRTAVIILWIMALPLSSISLYSIYPLTKAMLESRQWGLAFNFVLPILGVLLLFLAIRTTIQYRRFGPSFFQMNGKMGYIGGKLSGTLRSSVVLHPTGDYKIRLQCREHYFSGSGKQRRRCTRIIWERVKSFRPDSTNLLTGVPVSFDISPDCAESYDQTGPNEIRWVLMASAPMEGVDYEAEFEVPVFYPRVSR